MNESYPASTPDGRNTQGPAVVDDAPTGGRLDRVLAEARMESEGGKTVATPGTTATPPLQNRKADPGQDVREIHDDRLPHDADETVPGDADGRRRINPDAESEYWRGAYATRPYVDAGCVYEEYAPAYRMGWEVAGRGSIGRTFDSVEPELARGWDRARGSSRLAWDQARHAARDAWDRILGALDAPGGHSNIKERT